MFNSYSETVEWLFQQFPSYQNTGANAYKPSLENIQRLCAHFGNPQDRLRCIHVAGTNGKGSTCSMLASILTESGEKVGLFTSPHIHDFRERIRINGTMISEEFIISRTARIKNAQLDFEPSFFEISFLLALLAFEEHECSVCVIETGLGGRLDATNIIVPVISIITNISIEHTQFLGNTIASIAREKAGIIKQGVPVVIGEKEAVSAEVFTEVAQSRESTILFAEELDIPIPSNLPLLGSYQHRNCKLALAALKQLTGHFKITPESISSGLEHLTQNSGLFGRLQLMQQSPTVIFDVSHNPAGISETLQYVTQTVKGSLHIVYGTSGDKDLTEIFRLFDPSHRYYFTEFSNQRSAKLEQLKEKARQFELEATFFSNPPEALTAAQSAANKVDTILVFGSFFLLSDFF